MTREIKFRAWDAKKSIFVDEGEITFYFYGDSHIEVHPNSITYIGDQVHNREPERGRFTIQQYTGLKDKNGKEVYEGDILRRLPKDCWEKENFISFEVFYHGGNQAEDSVGFQMNRTHFHGCIVGYNMISAMKRFLPENVCKMEIIGNIYQNPELLGGENE
jgi:uncharacterized phage protein (TIGR01671 family)